MDLLEQDLVALDLVALAGRHGGEVQLYKVRDHVAHLAQPPVQRVEAAAQVDDLALVAGFLKGKERERDKNGTVPNQKGPE